MENSVRIQDMNNQTAVKSESPFLLVISSTVWDTIWYLDFLGDTLVCPAQRSHMSQYYPSHLSPHSSQWCQTYGQGRLFSLPSFYFIFISQCVHRVVSKFQLRIGFYLLASQW